MNKPGQSLTLNYLSQFPALLLIFRKLYKSSVLGMNDKSNAIIFVKSHQLVGIKKILTIQFGQFAKIK
jgi:hypothetical protein